ncbi:hypothetical protein E4U30_000761, partial [Claviceps sp. LM220 group G6]
MSDNHIREAQQLFRFLQADRQSDIVSRDEYTNIERVARESPLLDGHEFDFPVEWAGGSRQFRTFLKRWRQTNAAIPTKSPAPSDTTSPLPHPRTQSLEAKTDTNELSVLAGRLERLHLGSGAIAYDSTRVTEKGRNNAQEGIRIRTPLNNPPLPILPGAFPLSTTSPLSPEQSREAFPSEVQYPATPANKHQVPVTSGAPRIPRHHEAYHDQFGNLQLHDPNPEQVNAKP